MDSIGDTVYSADWLCHWDEPSLVIESKGWNSAFKKHHHLHSVSACVSPSALKDVHLHSLIAFVTSLQALGWPMRLCCAFGNWLTNEIAEDWIQNNTQSAVVVAVMECWGGYGNSFLLEEVDHVWSENRLACRTICSILGSFLKCPEAICYIKYGVIFRRALCIFPAWTVSRNSARHSDRHLKVTP